VADVILVVDDDPGVVDLLIESLEEEGYGAVGAHSAAEALELLGQREFDLVLSDVEMPKMRGIDLLRAIHAERPHQLVILITAFGSIQLAVECLRSGAIDFVTKPFDIDVLLASVRRALAERAIKRTIVRVRAARTSTRGQLVAKSASMQRVLALATRAAASAVPVLLTGESGVGKGAVARHIHDQSPRRSGTFVSVNCAALPPALVEAELFGAVRGAYTDATISRQGLFQEADGGTLFLDEVGELPLESQPKLLHALETRRVRPVGATREVVVDARIVAATNARLEERLRDARFRADLFYRLNVIAIEIPPLRERREDIEGLIDDFMSRTAAAGESRVVGIAAEALPWLLAHPWPGNIRQLFNTLERAVALAEHDTIVVDDLQFAAGGAEGEPGSLEAAALASRPLAEIEAEYIRRMLAATGGNVSQAARRLGIDRRTLQRKIERD
jgi:DNA-binding NtrC family response regulator